jgi:hypothetical protein
MAPYFWSTGTSRRVMSVDRKIVEVGHPSARAPGLPRDAEEDWRR